MTDSTCWMRPFIADASAGHKPKDWNASRRGLGPAWTTEAQCSQLFFYGGSDNRGSFLTSHLSKLPWVRNPGLNHTHCDSAFSTGCKILWLSQFDSGMEGVSLLLLLRRCLGLHRLDPRVTAHWSPRVLALRSSPSWEVHVVSSSRGAQWENLQNCNHRSVALAPVHEKPHRRGVQNNRENFFLNSRTQHTRVSFLECATSQWSRKKCKTPFQRTESLFRPN